MIEFGMMRLYLCKISIVEVSRILERARILEYYDSASPVTYCKQIASTIKRNSGESILLCHTQLISLAQAINIDPLHGRRALLHARRSWLTV